MNQKTCPSCGKRFTPWRGKTYCSERCRKRAQNERLGYVSRRDETLPATPVAEAEKSPSQDTENVEKKNEFRRDESAFWTACNEVTDKYARKGGDALGWAMQVEHWIDFMPPDPKLSRQILKMGWYGRVGKEMAFGPTTRHRARLSVEVYLRGEPFEKDEDERSWRGDCWSLISGR